MTEPEKLGLLGKQRVWRRSIYLVFWYEWPMVEQGVSAWTGDRNTAMSRGRDLRRDGLWDSQEAWRGGQGATAYVLLQT